MKITRYTRQLVLILVVTGCLAGCAKKPPPAPLTRTATGQTTLGNAHVIRYGDVLRIVLPTEKFLAPGTYVIQPDAINNLDETISLIKTYGNVPITVTGYTDPIGTLKAQDQRALMQAETIAAFLWGNGIAWHNLKVTGKGSNEPVSSPRAFGDNRNARIEITLQAQG